MPETLSVNSFGPLGHCWGTGNRLAVFTRPSHRNEKPTHPSAIHEIKWGTSMSSDEFMRRLCKSSFEIFQALQKSTQTEQFISSSMQYRAALAACSQEIMQFLKLHEEIGEAKSIHLAAECELIQCFELVWHLAELTFIQAFPNGQLAYNLCCWFHIQVQEAADNARQIMQLASGRRSRGSSFAAHQDNRFWPTVLLLVMQARVHDAASLLALHSHANSRGLRSLRQLLVSMPVASQSGGKSAWSASGVGFGQAWSYWQLECEHRRTSGDFDEVGAGSSASGGDPALSTYVPLLVGILSGRTDVWRNDRIRELNTGGSMPWYFLFVAHLFYTNQLVGVEELALHLDRWMAMPDGGRCHQQDSEGLFDEVIDQLIVSIFRLDLPSFVGIASGKLTNWWLVAHFTNLLHRVYPDVLVGVSVGEPAASFSSLGGGGSGSLSRARGTAGVIKLEDDSVFDTESSRPRGGFPRTANDQEPSLVDFLLTGYAEAIGSEASLLPVALGYLDFCRDGRHRQASLLLVHAVPVSTRATNWFMSLADSHGLTDVSEQIASIAARRLLPLTVAPRIPASASDHQPACLPSCAAMSWALLARDHVIVERIAELALSRDTGFDQAAGLTTELAELAAIVLGMCTRSGGDRDEVGDQSRRLAGVRLTPELAFLVRYAELQQCFNDGDTQAAADRLIDLVLTSGDSPVVPSSGISGDPAGGGVTCHLRLLSEVRHLLGRQCLRRDQVEILMATLVELRSELDSDLRSDLDRQSLLTSLHVALARELASCIFPSVSGQRLACQAVPSI